LKDIMILDGYNVMNALPELQRLTRTDFAGARDRLIEMMSEYRSFRGIDILVVFDAHLASKAQEYQEKVKGVDVVFTKEKMTADSYIEKTIGKLVEHRQVVVVTNDWTEQLMVLGSGAIRVSVRELEMDLREARCRITEATLSLNQEKDFLSNRIDPETLKKLEAFRRK
jgi:uncharacterized protein